MDKTQKEHILSQYYFDSKNAGSFLGAKKLHRILNQNYPRVFTTYFIQKWLNNQDSYAIQRQARHTYKRPRVEVAGMNDQGDMDLMAVDNIAKYNDGVKYLLIVIDIFSRFLSVRPLVNKKSNTVLLAIKDILSVHKFKKLRTDRGSEFINRELKAFMQKKRVYLFNTQSTAKANYAERVIRTLRGMIFRMLRYQRNYRYIDHLQDIVNSYNNSPHRSLDGLAPSDVTKKNETQLWSKMYLKPKKFPKTPPRFKYKIGDLVRLSYTKHPFRRAYQQQYTTEVFKIKSKIFKQGFPLYKIIDLNKEPISGYVNQNEIIPVDKDADSLWYVDKVLKKRKVKGKLEYFVRWEGFPKSFDSWIDADQVQEQ